MKLATHLKLGAIATITAMVIATIPNLSTIAAIIGEQPIEPTQIVAVAVPFGTSNYNLAVIEQIPNKKQCWSESGSQPTIIEPLWTTFDFTGQCRRSTDSNGYSVRLDGQDTSQDYLLSLIPKDNEVQLVAMNRNDRSRSVIGKTFGKADGKYLKIYLNPGWEFTERTVDDKTTGHFFFSGDSAAIAAAGDNPPAPTVATASFSDTANDIYKDEIEQAVALGFIAGFKDNTFRPQEPLTREQLVSMVMGALTKVKDIKIEEATQAITQPYPDVVASRWSATKIQWAKQNEIVKGYPDGTFQPEKPVTRAELMAVLQSAAKFVNVKRGLTPELKAGQPTVAFADISGHWAKDLINTMSGFCKVASPYNESGSNFSPDSPSGRNYAAAATLRMHHCVSGETKPATPTTPTNP
jgi:hypothetical protein